MKKDFANKLCLGGTMVWALDQEDKTSRESSKDLIGSDLKFPNELGDGTEAFYQNRAAAYHLQRDYGLAIFWTQCQNYDRPKCPMGFYALTYGHGKVYDADFGHVVADGCHGGGHGWNRALCAPSNLKGTCNWFGKAKSCNTQCPKGYYQISQNSHIAFEKTGCQTGRYAKYCCKDLISLDLSRCYDAKYVVAEILGGGYGNYDVDLYKRGLDYFNPAPRDIANLDMELRYDHPGWFGAGIEGHFDMVGNTAVWEPASTLQNINQPSATRNVRGRTVTSTIESTTSSTTTRVCDGSRTTQACHHYSSVIRQNPQWAVLTCPSSAPSGVRQATRIWNDQHDDAWSKTWISKRLECQRDEFPFFRFWGNAYGSWVRLTPEVDNRAGGKLAQDVCPEIWPTTTGNNVQGGQVHCIGDRCTTTVGRTNTVSIRAQSLRFTNCDQPDDAWTLNQYNPITLTSDRGFALMRNDPWYRAAGNRQHRPSVYADPPTPAMIQRKTPINRRDWIPEELIVDMGNSSRRATEEEIYHRHGLIKCREDDCAEEAQMLGLTHTLPPIDADSAVATTFAPSVATADIIVRPAH